MITNPAKLAKIFNEFFINKVKKLRAKSRKVPNSDPVLRVRKWLDKRPSPPPIFKIKKIDTEASAINNKRKSPLPKTFCMNSREGSSIQNVLVNVCGNVKGIIHDDMDANTNVETMTADFIDPNQRSNFSRDIPNSPTS